MECVKEVSEALRELRVQRLKSPLCFRWNVTHETSFPSWHTASIWPLDFEWAMPGASKRRKKFCTHIRGSLIPSYGKGFGFIFGAFCGAVRDDEEVCEVGICSRCISEESVG